MSTLKTIGNKLFKEDLSSHKVTLANINELSQLVSNSEKDLVTYNSLYEKISGLKTQILKSGEDIRQSLQKMNMLAGPLEKQFAELGLKFSDSKEFKRVSEFIDKSRNVADTVGYIKQI